MMLDQMLEGATLRMVMWPDEEVVPEMPPHVESFDLPHVIFPKPDVFWGLTHNQHSSGEGLVPSSFCYPSEGGIFCSFLPSQGTITMIQETRYKKREWRVSHRHQLIWDSGEDDTPAFIERAVLDGRPLRVGFLDGEDCWNFHPVHLPMVGGDFFELVTPMDTYPMIVRSPTGIEELESACENIKRDRLITLFAHSKIFCVWYSLKQLMYRRSLGSEYHAYKRLLVFEEKPS